MASGAASTAESRREQADVPAAHSAAVNFSVEPNPAGVPHDAAVSSPWLSVVGGGRAYKSILSDSSRGAWGDLC